MSYLLVLRRMEWSYEELLATPEWVIDDVLLMMEAEGRDAVEASRELERKRKQ